MYMKHIKERQLGMIVLVGARRKLLAELLKNETSDDLRSQNVVGYKALDKLVEFGNRSVWKTIR